MGTGSQIKRDKKREAGGYPEETSTSGCSEKYIGLRNQTLLDLGSVRF